MPQETTGTENTHKTRVVLGKPLAHQRFPHAYVTHYVPVHHAAKGYCMGFVHTSLTGRADVWHLYFKRHGRPPAEQIRMTFESRTVASIMEAVKHMLSILDFTVVPDYERSK
jgi:hypothetical protein